MLEYGSHLRVTVPYVFHSYENCSSTCSTLWTKIVQFSDISLYSLLYFLTEDDKGSEMGKPLPTFVINMLVWILPKEKEEEEEDNEESSCIQTISLVWYKAFYLFFIGAFWMKIVYLPLYFKQIGLPAHYAGVLAGISPFLRGAGSFFLGLLAEKPETRKFVLLMSLVAQILTPLLCLIPHPSNTIPQGPFMNNDTWLVNMTSIIPMGDPPADDFLETFPNCFKGNCLGYQLLTEDSPEIRVVDHKAVRFSNSTISKSPLLSIKLDVMSTFWIILAIITVGEFLGGPARCLADAATLQALGKNKRNFGYVRLWGNVGQLLLTGIIYLLLRYQHVKLHGIEQGNYLFAVIVIVFWMALAFPTALGFACDHYNDSFVKDVSEKELQNGTEISDVLISFQSLSLLAITFCIGMLNGTFNTFMFWFVIDIAGSRANLIITVALALRIMYIILAFRVSGPIIRALGVMNVTHVSLFMYCGIFVMYGLMRNPWLAIIPEVLQNVIKAMTEVAVILFFGEITPFRWAATVQGIIQSLLEGFGFGLGPIIGGFLVMSLGIRTTFILFGAFAAGVGIFSLCSHGANWFVNRTTTDEEQESFKPLHVKGDY